MLAYDVVTGVSDSFVVGIDEVDFGIKSGVDLFLVFNLLLLLFPAILAGVLVLLLQVAFGILSTLVPRRHLFQTAIKFESFAKQLTGNYFWKTLLLRCLTEF